VSDSWDDIQASCAAFVEAVRERIAREPDMTMGRVHRNYTAAMCIIRIVCGESRGSVYWYEEQRSLVQLDHQIDELLAGLRYCESRRVAERDILLGTVARFYVDEEGVPT
jgi:hypothetical protein